MPIIRKIGQGFMKLFKK